jgi:hypothetical protein
MVTVGNLLFGRLMREMLVSFSEGLYRAHTQRTVITCDRLEVGKPSKPEWHAVAVFLGPIDKEMRKVSDRQRS